MMRRKSSNQFLVMVMVIYIIATIGYVMNVVKLATSDFESPYKAEVIYGVGTIVPPVGAIIGWINIKDE